MLHVAIVGGGPAGLVAATELARGGVRATLIERAPSRRKVCAGLVASPLLKAHDLPEMVLGARVSDLRLVSPTLRARFLPLHVGERYAAVVNPDLLMTLLRRRAEEAGVEFVTALFTRFRHGDGDYPLLELKLPSGARETLAADVVVGADGVHSRVARSLGLKPLPLGIAYQERLTLASSGSTAQLHFGRKISADAFGYALPSSDQELTVGVSTQAGYGRRVWDMLTELKKRLGPQLDGAKNNGREAYCYPTDLRRTLVHDHVLLVGDAAGLVPGPTRDGLTYAMESGRLAAATILRHQHVPVTERLQEYETAWWAAHGETFATLKRLEETFFATDRHREALVDLAGERAAQVVAIESFLTKRPFAPPLPLKLKLKTRLVGQLLKYSLNQPRRAESDVMARALPASENYLDLALRSSEPSSLERVVPAEPLELER